jgi:hypothetical protein
MDDIVFAESAARFAARSHDMGFGLQCAKLPACRRLAVLALVGGMIRFTLMDTDIPKAQTCTT